MGMHEIAAVARVVALCYENSGPIAAAASLLAEFPDRPPPGTSGARDRLHVPDFDQVPCPSARGPRTRLGVSSLARACSGAGRVVGGPGGESGRMIGAPDRLESPPVVLQFSYSFRPRMP